MKKILLVGALTLATGLSYSQTIIPKAGLVVSSFLGKDKLQEDRSTVGFTAGVGFNMPVGDGGFSVQTELNYIQKGSEAEYVAERSHDKLTLGYLEIPLLAKITFGDFPSEFYVNFGPSFGFGLGGKYKKEGGLYPESQKVKFGEGDDPDKYYVENGLDVGVQLGMGLIILERVMVDVRYGLGVTNIYKDYKITNSAFQLTVGSPLSLGGGRGGRRR